MSAPRDPSGLGRRFDPDAGWRDFWPFGLAGLVIVAAAAALTIGFGDLLLDLWRRP